MRGKFITLLTDFGSVDHYVAAMKGVMLGIDPRIRFIDITHEIRPCAIGEGAYTLSQAWRLFPKGTVHLVVIDPGVGSSRRPVIAEADGHRFVAPDNGVLTMILDCARRSAVREITASRYFRHPVSRTFHGRDIFAPVAAHLAKGEPSVNFGKRIDDWVRLELHHPIRSRYSAWTGSVLKVDRFGNVITSFDSNTFGWIANEGMGRFELRAGKQTISRLTTNYAAISDRKPFLIPGSGGYIEISINQGSAAEGLGVTAGSPLVLRRGKPS